MVEVIDIGSWVIIGDDVPAKVTRICIRDNGNVSYELSWWDGRTRKSEWLEAFEVTTDSERGSLQIGFLSAHRAFAP